MKRWLSVLGLILLFALALAPASQVAAQDTGSITTTFSANNSFAGNMFDVQALSNDVTITSFDVNLDPAGPGVTVDVYYRPGSYVGNESSSAGWTLLGSSTVNAQGLNNPTPLPVGGLTIPQGQTYGIYVDVANYPSSSLQYTNGNNLYNNGDVQVTTGIGKGNPAFTGSTFTPRTWNGTIYYILGPVGSDDGDDEPEAGPPCWNLFDGRINKDQSLDCAAPVAIYLNGELGTVDVYAINPANGEGMLALRHPLDGPIPTGANETLGSQPNPFTGANLLLSRLTSGEFQLNTTGADGKPYIVVWAADGQAYHLAQ